MDDAHIWTSGRGVADRGAPGGCLRTHRRGRVEGRWRPRTRGILRRSISGFAAGARSQLDPRGANAIARLTKSDVEVLLADYDIEPVEAVATALRIVLGRPEAAWPELIAAAQFPDTRAAALLIGEERALDALAAELNELRSLATD